MRKQGHPFAAVPERQVIVDHASLEMEVTLMVEPGPRAVFGTVTIEGLEEMDEGFAQSRLDPGADVAYSPEEVRSMRDRLADLEVFSRIGVETADTLDTDSRLPVFVVVTERPRRVIGFSAAFNTSEGFGASAYWGHRNLFGRAENLRLQAAVGRIGRNAPTTSTTASARATRHPIFSRVTRSCSPSSLRAGRPRRPTAGRQSRRS
jgi:translocation and assembly module TamA